MNFDMVLSALKSSRKNQVRNRVEPEKLNLVESKTSRVGRNTDSSQVSDQPLAKTLKLSRN